MSRSVVTALLNSLQSTEVRPFFAFKALFDNGNLRFWTGIGNRTINGEVYTGSGDVIGIGGIEEVVDLSARRMTITINGVDSAVTNLALTEPYQNRSAYVYLGEQSQSDVLQIFAGTVDTMAIMDQGDQSFIEIGLESNLIRLQQSSNWRYTDENHRSRYSGDTFFSYVQDIQDRVVVWGRENV